MLFVAVTTDFDSPVHLVCRPKRCQIVVIWMFIPTSPATGRAMRMGLTATEIKTRPQIKPRVQTRSDLWLPSLLSIGLAIRPAIKKPLILKLQRKYWRRRKGRIYPLQFSFVCKGFRKNTQIIPEEE